MIGSRRAWAILLLVGPASALPGCGGLDTSYGDANGGSVNGTGALFRLFKAKGHEVRIARRYSDRVEGWADTIVRFSPHPGPPDAKEAEWLERWLSASPERRLIYVPRDFEAQQEYWAEVIRRLPAVVDASKKRRMEGDLARASTWPADLPPKAKDPAKKEEWFAVDESNKASIACKTLEGPWSGGVDAGAAGIARRQSIAIEAETLLLSGDGKPLVVDYTWSTGSRVLIVANGSFLLNEPLAHAPRRPLATRVVDWPGGEGRHVAFVEGRASADRSAHPTSMLGLLDVDPFGWIGGHLIALGLVGGLAASVRLGRPRGEPDSGADRPVAHAEALGGLLSRARDARAAAGEIEAYRRWRHPGSGVGRPPSTSTTRARAATRPTVVPPEGPR